MGLFGTGERRVDTDEIQLKKLTAPGFYPMGYRYLHLWYLQMRVESASFTQQFSQPYTNAIKIVRT